MTGQKRDVEEVLSRVLHSTTDHVEPVGDGLAKIQARLSEPWLKRQWWLLHSEFMMLGWLVAVRCESLFSAVRARLGADETGPGAADPEAGTAGAGHGGWQRRLAPIFGGIVAWASGKGDPRRSPGPVMNWLRPALAVAGAVVLVVAGVFALGQIRQSIQAGLSAGGGYTPGTSSQTGGPGHPNGRNGGSVGGGQAPTSQSSTSARPGPTHRAGMDSSASPCPTPTKPAGGATPTPSPSPPASPTPTPTPTPTATTTPTATATPTLSQGPLSSTGAVKDRAAHGTRTTALVCVRAGASPSASPA